MLKDKKDYQGSIDSALSLIKKFSGEKYWESKSFLLIGDNYELMGEDFQAAALYESIVNHTSYEGVKQEAQQKWDAMLEAKMKLDSIEIVPDTIEIGGNEENLNNAIDETNE